MLGSRRAVKSKNEVVSEVVDGSVSSLWRWEEEGAPVRYAADHAAGLED